MSRTHQSDLTPSTDASPTAASTDSVLTGVELLAGPNLAYTQKFRPQFHFSPLSGWLGDPDGMVRYNDIYHIFWWGHAVSMDLVHWQELPYPMTGDDGSFVYFTGSVVVDEQDSAGFTRGPAPPMVAIYTMHDRASGEETQALSISHDHRRFDFYAGNPVLDHEEAAFRDPAVFFHDPSGRWVMAITLPEQRKISFYASTDLKCWEHLSDFGPLGARSELWEVPDLFELPIDGDARNTRWVLLCGMGPNKEQYFVGDFDGATFTLDPVANGYLLRGEGMPGTIFADFEQGLPTGWTVEGHGAVVEPGARQDFYRVTGYLGAGFLSTYTPQSASGDRGKTCVTSPPFVIEQSAINLLVSGGQHDDNLSVNLIVNGEVVRSAGGGNTLQMKWVGWDVRNLIGAEAQIQIVDASSGADVGHLNVDHIIFSNALMETGREHANWLDFGADYYAVRTYRDYDAADSGTITMGWMGNWEYAREAPTSWGKGALALPREIELRSYSGGLRLTQRPIPALESLRQNETQAANLPLEPGVTPLAAFAPPRNTYELDVIFEVTDPAARFGLKLAGNGESGVRVGYDARTARIFIDRTRLENSEFSPHFSKFLPAPLEPVDGLIRLRIFVDQSSIEVFANDGVTTLTALIFPEDGSTALAWFAEDGGALVRSFRAWELTSIWNIASR